MEALMMDTETWQTPVTALGWALIHFIWQGTFVALLLAVVLRMLRGASTNVRYAAACAALLLMLIAPLTTMTTLGLAMPGKVASGPSPMSAAQPESKPLTVEIQPTITPTQTADLTASPRSWLSIRSESIAPLLAWMVLLWLLGVACFSLRLIGGWLYIRRLQQYGTSPLEERWRQSLHRLCSQLRVTRPVRLLESAMVKVPMVVGWLRPVILLPASALTGLTAQQLEAIIAHELAHIRRHDYLFNLLQAVVETLLFYHPAVWWVSRQIRQEREHCCDDLAVAVCGDALTYARALLELEQLRAAGPQLVMAANGGLLMNRIQRLVGAQTQYNNRGAGLFAGVIALTTLIGVVAGAQILLQSSGSPDRQIVSTQWREVRKVNTSAETPGESNSAHERAVELLLKALLDSKWAAAEQAARSLGTTDREWAVEALINALRDQREQAPKGAAKPFGMIIGDRRAPEPWNQVLQDVYEQARKKAGAAPKLIDPGFEAFAPARAPIYGWYSDELIHGGQEGFGVVRMTPDATHKVEGKYSLRIEQQRVRPPNRGYAFLAQSVRLPARGSAPRRFDLSAQMRGQKGLVMIHIYVWEENNVARLIAERDVKVTKAWSTAALKFDVPHGYDRFGVWFYLPRDEETQIWFDDVRLLPSAN
jgi:beta-lactamase regulating signal transducer with metallopeptidase domain